MRRTILRPATMAAVACALLLLTGCATAEVGPDMAPTSATQTPASTPATTPAPAPAFVPPTPEQLAAQPIAYFDAVIPTLVPSTLTAEALEAEAQTFTPTGPTALYSAPDQSALIAVLPAESWDGQPSVTIAWPSEIPGWWLVLTPSRVVQPSTVAAGTAPAQSMAYVHESQLAGQLSPVATPVTVSLSSSTASYGGITETVGFGSPGTETPTGIGVVLGTYQDSGQASEGWISATSLHSVAADVVYRDAAGALIGVHETQGASSSAVSHGCIRAPQIAVALSAVPAGTPVIITE